MPRGAKKTAHQHNNRHENGIVAPGKRITKQKSNGHINGSADGSPQPTTPPPASPAASRSYVPDKRTNESRNAFADMEDLDGRGSGDISEDLGMSLQNTANTLLDRNHRKIDVNAAKNPSIHDNSQFSLALTILWSCPIADTLAILIFLLSLPPTFLTLINTLFAILTFMPPTTSLSTFPTTFSEMFQGCGGTPSFATVIVSDVVGLMAWLSIQTPLQVLALELAQAVVATTLGGGISGKNKNSDYTFFCMGVVMLSHVARHRWIQNRFFGYDWTVRLASLSKLAMGPAHLFSNDSNTSRNLAGWFRILVTLHVLTQGIVHVIRRWYSKRGHIPPISASKRTAPDVGAGPPTRADLMPPLTPTTSLSSSSQEPMTKPLLPSARDAREKSNKKKRRPGTDVRSQQPLWAAFAATKVTVCREFDQSKILQEATGSNATDLRNLGDAPFAIEEGRVWITSIHLNSISFEASHFSKKPAEADEAESTKPAVGARVDRSKPFFVRINGADWSSTFIRCMEEGEAEDGSADPHWEGEIFGLSPSSSYICCFVRCEDGVEIYSTHVSTPSSSPPDQDPSATVTSPNQAHRPSSPTSPATTLRNSIAACEATLVDSQARQKRSKKDNKAASAALKKEIDIFNSRLAKIAVEDKAHHNRQLQWNQQSRQADEAVAAMSTELESLGSIPEEDQQHWTSRKSEWRVAREHRSSGQSELSSFKDSADQERAAARGEATNTQQKRERLTARATKLYEQRQRLQSANAQGLDDKQRREAELAARAEDRRQNEERSQAQMAGLERSADNVQQSLQQARQRAQVFINAYNQQQLMNATLNDSTIPEIDLPSHVPHSSAGLSFGYPTFGHPEKDTVRNKAASFHHENRPRSSSLLSNDNSVPNDFDDQDPAPPMPSTKSAGRMNGRHASGSSSGNGGIRMSPAHKSGSPIWN